MNDLRTAAQQALEALEGGADSWQLVDPAITALKAALAEPQLAPAPGYCKHCKQYTIEEPLPADPVQEPTVPSDRADSHQPVAWVCYGSSSDEKHAIDYQQEDIDAVPVGTMLYTAPQRKPLTEEEMRTLADKHLACQSDSYEVSGVFDLIRAIERAHGIGGQDE